MSLCIIVRHCPSSYVTARHRVSPSGTRVQYLYDWDTGDSVTVRHCASSRVTAHHRTSPRVTVGYLSRQQPYDGGIVTEAGDAIRDEALLDQLLLRRFEDVRHVELVQHLRREIHAEVSQPIHLRNESTNVRQVTN